MSFTGTHIGTFWLADAPDNAFYGRFTTGPGIAPALEVFGELSSTMKVISESTSDGVTSRTMTYFGPGEAPTLTIHGDLFQLSQRVTLIEARSTGHSKRHGSRVRDPGTQRFEATYALLGDHVGSDQRFSSVRLRLQHLDEWASLSGFYTAGDEPRADLVGHKFELPPSVELEGGGTIGFDPTISVAGPTAAGVELSRATFLVVSDVSPSSWPELDRLIVTPLTSLLTLAIGSRCAPIETHLRGDDGRWLEVLGGWLADEPAQVLNVPDMLLPYGVLGLDHLAHWLSRVATLGPLPPVVADSVAGGHRTLETELLELATVAEGLHSRLHPDKRQITEEDAARVRECAVEAVAASLDEGLAETLKRALAHFGDLSYPQRVAELAALAEQCVPGIVGKANRWKQAVVKSRNSFAHRSGVGFLSDADLDQYIGVMVSLQWVLRIVLLLQTGLSAEVIGGHVRADGRYLLFLPQARQRLPRVYQVTKK